MMDKKTLGLMLILGLGIAFVYFFSKNQKTPDFFKFGSYLENSSSDSAKRGFSALIETPTPTDTPVPSEIPLPTLAPL